MRVIDVAIGQVYRFNCPYCGSKLEAESRDLFDLGCKVSEFFCPVCEKRRSISWSSLRKRIIYENQAAE